MCSTKPPPSGGNSIRDAKWKKGGAPRGKHGRETFPTRTGEDHPKLVRPAVEAGAEGSHQRFVLRSAGQFLNLVQQEDGLVPPSGDAFEKAVQMEQQGVRRAAPKLRQIHLRFDADPEGSRREPEFRCEGRCRTADPFPKTRSGEPGFEFMEQHPEGREGRLPERGIDHRVSPFLGKGSEVL